MIIYESGCNGFLSKMIQVRGSVFPKAGLVAVPCAILTAMIRMLIDEGYISSLENEDSILKESALWGGFSALVGFLIVFRTSQAHNRFWDGCTAVHTMRAEWFDAASALVAFSRHSVADGGMVAEFNHKVIRLFSMMHAVALGHIQDTKDGKTPPPVSSLTSDGSLTVDLSNPSMMINFELLDAESFDERTLMKVMTSDSRPELIFTWIEMTIVDALSTGVMSIPPPILSRVFQELANGMVALYDAKRLADTPFPFPYAQTCDCLLVIHWIVSPFVHSQWVTYPWWAAVFSFAQVFIFWALNFIAVEIEMPFGNDSNDIDCDSMQEEMNHNLRLLARIEEDGLPSLVGDARTWYENLVNQDRGNDILEVMKRTSVHVHIKNQGNRRHSSRLKRLSQRSSTSSMQSAGLERREPKLQAGNNTQLKAGILPPEPRDGRNVRPLPMRSDYMRQADCDMPGEGQNKLRPVQQQHAVPIVEPANVRGDWEAISQPEGALVPAAQRISQHSSDEDLREGAGVAHSPATNPALVVTRINYHREVSHGSHVLAVPPQPPQPEEIVHAVPLMTMQQRQLSAEVPPLSTNPLHPLPGPPRLPSPMRM